MKPRRSWRRYLPVVVPLVFGLVAYRLGHPSRAAVLLLLAAAAAVLIQSGVPVDRFVARFATAVAHWVGVLATGVVGVGLAAVGGLLRLVGRDPLTPRRARAGGWRRSPSPDSSQQFATSAFGLDPATASAANASGGRHPVGRAVLLSIGAVAAVLVLDLGVGVTWEAMRSDDGPVGQVVDSINLSGDRTTVHDIRADLPAMASSPWADAYFRETQQTPNSYWPFTESRPLPFRGKYVNLDGWSRRSYEPRGRSDVMPVVWMFGGSTTWGEGQRDMHTIASDIARISERARTPVRVVNYGQRGWTHFQELILFEQLLASEPAPDLVLFYDGANEINAQSLSAKGVPTHTLVDQYALKLSGSGVAQEFSNQGASEPGAFATIWATYSRHSAIRKLVGRVGDVVDPPVGAAQWDHRPAALDGSEGHGQNYVKTEVDARNAVAVYERGRRLTRLLAEDHGVDTVFFWQPVMVGPAEEWANAHISPPTVNISDALDGHQDVFIDGGHTNEDGARIVAERIWQEIAPKVGRIYGD